MGYMTMGTNDFNIVKRQVITEYVELFGNARKGDVWSLGDCLNVFRYYFIRYEQKTGQAHPHLSNETIKDIILKFPYLDAECPNDHSANYDLEPQNYDLLIDKYFEQTFNDCNYSIAHFMSGNIRTLRFYEELY